MHYYKFPVGDYSFDGHACVANFIVRGQKPLIEVQETHISQPWIGLIASEYDDNTVLQNLVNKLPYPEAGTVFLEALIEKHNLEIEEDDWSEEGNESEIHLTYDSLIELWIFLLNQYNPNLQLEIISPALVFTEKKKIKYLPKGSTIEGSIERYSGQIGGLQIPGYGVWEDYEGEFFTNCN